MLMASDIELECPSCSALLQLDAGFAGGVCRCSDCGTLMTVPSTAGEKTQQLRRRLDPNASEKPAADKATRDQPTSPPTEPVGEEVYVTESGQAVKVDAQRVPTARKRKGVRAATVAVVVLVLLLVVGGVGYVGYLLYQQLNDAPGDPDAPLVQEESFQYDRKVNPFTLQAPNALGFPLRPKTAIVIESSASATDNRDNIHAALRKGLLGRESDREVMLVMAGPRGLTEIKRWTELNDLDADDLGDLFDKPVSPGASDLAGALQAAVDAQPDVVLLVIGNAPAKAVQIEVAEILAAHPDLTVDILLLKGVALTLKNAIDDGLGRYVVLPRNTLAQWREDAQAGD